jgi:hypothetical protein
MKLRFFKLKVAAGTGKKGISPYGMLNQSNQPTKCGYSSPLDPPYE